MVVPPPAPIARREMGRPAAYFTPQSKTSVGRNTTRAARSAAATVWPPAADKPPASADREGILHVPERMRGGVLQSPPSESRVRRRGCATALRLARMDVASIISKPAAFT